MTATDLPTDDWMTYWEEQGYPVLPRDAHRFMPISLHVAKRRLLRLFFMSKMCEILPDDYKTLIWRYLPRKQDDDERERFLWYVRTYEFNWDTNIDDAWGFVLPYYDDPEIIIACMSCPRNAERGMHNMSRDLLKNKDVVLTAVRHCGMPCVVW